MPQVLDIELRLKYVEQPVACAELRGEGRLTRKLFGHAGKPWPHAASPQFERAVA